MASAVREDKRWKVARLAAVRVALCGFSLIGQAPFCARPGNASPGRCPQGLPSLHRIRCAVSIHVRSLHMLAAFAFALATSGCGASVNLAKRTFSATPSKA